MKTKHTDGPWIADAVNMIYPQNANPSPYNAIATAFDFNTEKAKANALLIASAPELLEALENLLPFVIYRGNINAINAKKFAENAIKKAKGE